MENKVDDKQKPSNPGNVSVIRFDLTSDAEKTVKSMLDDIVEAVRWVHPFTDQDATKRMEASPVTYTTIADYDGKIHYLLYVRDDVMKRAAGALSIAASAACSMCSDLIGAAPVLRGLEQVQEGAVANIRENPPKNGECVAIMPDGTYRQ